MLEGAGDLAVRTVREPAPAVGEVLIEVAWCGICGTDRHIYEGQYGGDNLPLTLGHEFSGRIASDPTGRLAAGTAVVVDINVQCGRCRFCRAGDHMSCPELAQIGVHRSGAFAPLVSVPAAQVHPLPAGMPLDVAAMTEPLACVVHAQSKLRWTPGATVAVFGAGPIGVLHGQLALARGAARVLMVDISRARLDAVADLEGMVPVDATNDGVGAIRWLTDGRGADIVIETAAVPASYEAAQRAVRSGGQLLLFGIPGAGLETAVRPHDLVVREITIRGSNGAGPAAWPAAIDLLSAGTIDVTHLLRDRIDLATVVERITGEPEQRAPYKSIAVLAGAQA